MCQTFSMNYQKGFVVPLLLALIALVFIGGGTYVYVQNKQANQPVIATSSAQTSNSQTVGWKTYTDNVIGFQFQYPSTWESPRITGDYSGINPYSVVMGTFSIYVSTTTTDSTFISNINKNARKENVAVGGQKGIKIHFPDEQEMFKGAKAILTQFPNRIVVINYEDNGSEMNQIYEQIISTFQFNP